MRIPATILSSSPPVLCPSARSRLSTTVKTAPSTAKRAARLCVHRLGQLEAGLLQLVGGAVDPGHVLAAQRVLQILQLGLDLLPLVGGNLVAHLAQHPLGLVGQ